MTEVLSYENPITGEISEAAVVHKADEEGSLLIHRTAGHILTPPMERPDWAEGLVSAVLEEHRVWWKARLGYYHARDLYSADDLTWTAVDEDGELAEVPASEEHRMEKLAVILGLDREDGTMREALADIEMSLDHYRDDGEAFEFEAARQSAFEDARKTA